MKQFLVQFKKDFAAYFSGVNAYLIIFAYYLLSFFSALYLGDYFVRETDVMNAYFVMQPLVLVLIIPAVTMRTWADEIKSGTIELLLTQPISHTVLALSKFCAAFAFFLVLILCSVPFLFISGILSFLDWGMVISAYLGLIFSGALFTAAGCLISSCCRSVITSFVCTVFVLFFILQLDFSASGTCLPVNAFGFGYHYRAFLSGALLWGNSAYFILATLLLLWLNVVMLTQRSDTSANGKRLFRYFSVLLFVIFFSGNLSAFLFSDTIADFTDNKMYTLTEKNRNFLHSLDKRIDITLYEAKSKREDGSSRYASYAAYIERFLQQIQKYSFGAVRYSVIRVEPFSALERRLIRDNIPYEEDNFGNKSFMAMDVSDNSGNMLQINALESLRQNLLETDIMRLIRMFGKEKKSVALYVSSDELNEMQGFYNFLNEFYNVDFIHSDTQFIPNTYDAVILINPTELSYGFLPALDQYILNGGNVVMFHEPSLLGHGDNSDLSDFLNTYGIKPLANFDIADGSSPIRPAMPYKAEDRDDIRVVMTNEAGEVQTRPSRLFASMPILVSDNKNIGVLTKGKFETHYREFAENRAGFLSESSQSGQFFFFYDSDILKDYLYAADESKGAGFYQIVSFADNQLFYLQLIDKATHNGIETELNYPHYSMNLAGISTFILKAQQKNYQEMLDTLQTKINSLKKALDFADTSSVRNLGTRHKLTLDLEEAEDALNETKKLIIADYHSAIAGLTIGILLVIPCFLLGILCLALYIFRKHKRCKIRRLISDEITH